MSLFPCKLSLLQSEFYDSDETPDVIELPPSGNFTREIPRSLFYVPTLGTTECPLGDSLMAGRIPRGESGLLTGLPKIPEAVFKQKSSELNLDYDKTDLNTFARMKVAHELHACWTHCPFCSVRLR